MNHTKENKDMYEKNIYEKKESQGCKRKARKMGWKNTNDHAKYAGNSEDSNKGMRNKRIKWSSSKRAFHSTSTVSTSPVKNKG